jgi:hypothetical protein
MHFSQDIQQRITISLDLVDVMVKAQEFNEAHSTIESTYELAKNNTFFEEDIKLKCRIL